MRKAWAPAVKIEFDIEGHSQADGLISPFARVDPGAAGAVREAPVFERAGGALPRHLQRQGSLSQIPVAIIDKCRLFRAALASMLVKGGCRIVGSGCEIEDASVAALGPDGVVLIALRDASPRRLGDIADLAQRGIRVIVLAEQLVDAEVRAVIEAGAHGFLLRDEIGADELFKSLECVRGGGMVFPSRFSDLPGERRPHGTSSRVGQSNGDATAGASDAAGDGAPSTRRPLSGRERTILMMLAQGASNKVIARKLAISEATVKVHMKNLLRKMDVQNRTQAAVWGARYLKIGALAAALLFVADAKIGVFAPAFLLAA